jgi:hypothetical protein
MRTEDVVKVKELSAKVAQLCDELLNTGPDEGLLRGTGTLKRASMELTRALADLRGANRKRAFWREREAATKAYLDGKGPVQ